GAGGLGRSAVGGRGGTGGRDDDPVARAGQYAPQGPKGTTESGADRRAGAAAAAPARGRCSAVPVAAFGVPPACELTEPGLVRSRFSVGAVLLARFAAGVPGPGWAARRARRAPECG